MTDAAPRNVLIIMADEHAPDALSCAGGIAQTPNLDALAAAGTRFSRAYTPSPICVPARAAFQTGRYVHDIGCWSNAEPYHGHHPGWGHRLIENGHEVVSVGKLHFRRTEDDNGFSREIRPLHVLGGVGWVQALLRRGYHVFDTSGYAAKIGPGDDPYTDYDRAVCDDAVQWLKTEGAAKRDKPWVLFVSFLRPHYPLTCPPEFYNLYDPDTLPPRRFAGKDVEFRHPVMAAFKMFNDYDDHFPDDHARQVARASYFGLCSFTDDLVGQVMRALADAGRDHDTSVIYTSDHGELPGDHGLWTKMCMYEGSMGIPMIVSGAGAPTGVCDTQTSLVDVHQTVLEAAGLGLSDDDADRPGRSLYDVAANPDPDRVVLSEFHDGGAITGFFGVRVGDWKYVAYPGFAPQLFNLADDPHEVVDLGLSADHADVRAMCHARLMDICDPDAVNDACFRDQNARIEELGGAEAVVNAPGYDHTPVDG